MTTLSAFGFVVTLSANPSGWPIRFPIESPDLADGMGSPTRLGAIHHTHLQGARKPAWMLDLAVSGVSSTILKKGMKRGRPAETLAIPRDSWSADAR